PQIALLAVRRPQARKTPFHHQLQNVGRIPFVRLLLAHVTGPDLRRIPDPDFVPQVLDQFDEPLAVARGLHADPRRRRQLLIERLGVTRSVHQLLSPGFPSLRVQPRHLLPAGMEITPYNHHAKAPSFPRSLGPQPKTTRSESSLRSYLINSFAFFANEWAARTLPVTKRLDRTTLRALRRIVYSERGETLRRREYGE